MRKSQSKRPKYTGIPIQIEVDRISFDLDRSGTAEIIILNTEQRAEVGYRAVFIDRKFKILLEKPAIWAQAPWVNIPDSKLKHLIYHELDIAGMIIVDEYLFEIGKKR